MLNLWEKKFKGEHLMVQLRKAAAYLFGKIEYWYATQEDKELLREWYRYTSSRTLSKEENPNYKLTYEEELLSFTDQCSFANTQIYNFVVKMYDTIIKQKPQIQIQLLNEKELVLNALSRLAEMISLWGFTYGEGVWFVFELKLKELIKEERKTYDYVAGVLPIVKKGGYGMDFGVDDSYMEFETKFISDLWSFFQEEMRIARLLKESYKIVDEVAKKMPNQLGNFILTMQKEKRKMSDKVVDKVKVVLDNYGMSMKEFIEEYGDMVEGK